MKNEKKPESPMTYLPIGMSIGISIGVAIGAATHNIPICMSIGLSIGLGIGACIDAQNRKQANTPKPNEEERQEPMKNDNEEA